MLRPVYLFLPLCMPSRTLRLCVEIKTARKAAKAQRPMPNITLQGIFVYTRYCMQIVLPDTNYAFSGLEGTKNTATR